MVCCRPADVVPMVDERDPVAGLACRAGPSHRVVAQETTELQEQHVRSETPEDCHPFTQIHVSLHFSRVY